MQEKPWQCLTLRQTLFSPPSLPLLPSYINILLGYVVPQKLPIPLVANQLVLAELQVKKRVVSPITKLRVVPDHV